MTELRRYRSMISDSARWDGFELREGDILISTPPKCGTTWTQMLCAMLVFGTVELDRPLTDISPWLDAQTCPLATVVANLDAQDHRRIIKTHTPLDGLPDDRRVTYIAVGRDPRDVCLSFEHHLSNLDIEAFMAARAAAVGTADLAGFGPPPGPPPDDPLERFWLWADAVPGDVDGFNLATMLHHLETFWDRRDQPQVALFHYADLLADLPGQLRRLAGVLHIDLPDERLGQLAAAATFQAMKGNFEQLAPDMAAGIWRDKSAFFDLGTCGQWCDLLDDAATARYEARVSTLVAPDLADWVHHGWLGLHG